MDAREADWDAVHEALPARWTVDQASMADPLTRKWSVTAQGLRGRAASGLGMVERRRQHRKAYFDGAEEWSRDNIGRSLTMEELEGVLTRYGGR